MPNFRLDFEQFSNLGPADTVETTGGACQDSFSVTVNWNEQKQPLHIR